LCHNAQAINNPIVSFFQNGICLFYNNDSNILKGYEMRYKFVVIFALALMILAGCAPAATPAAPAATEAPAATVAPAAAVAPTEAAPTAAAPAEAAPAVMSETGLPEVNPLEVTGDIVVAGSSTVYPLTEAIAERFTDEGYAGNITIDSIGTGAGFERFCVAGETDISNASRPIKDSEKESCAAINRTPIEFRVGTDALAVVINPENDWATSVTIEELAGLFSTATTWADVNPAWPAEPIQRFIPGTDSGTFDYFVEEIFAKDEAPILSAANTQLSEDDNVLVQGVEGSKYGIGFFGYAYYKENADRLHVLSIEGVEPDAENVDNNSYPLARPLFIYSDANVMADKPQVAAFINFYLSYVNEEIVRVGYFPSSADALEEGKANFLAAIGQ
jgi:phosphate transport system substrate-binding protein